MEVIKIIIIGITAFLQAKGIADGWKISGVKSLLDIMVCSKCLVFIMVLIATGNLFLSSLMALSTYLLEKIYMDI